MGNLSGSDFRIYSKDEIGRLVDNNVNDFTLEGFRLGQIYMTNDEVKDLCETQLNHGL